MELSHRLEFGRRQGVYFSCEFIKFLQLYTWSYKLEKAA